MSHIVIYDTNEAGLGAISAAKRLGHRVTFVDPADARYYAETPANLQVMRSADRYVTREWLTNPDVAAEVLAMISAEEPIDAVLTTNEHSVDALSQACGRLRLPFTQAAAVALARRKHELRSRLLEKGVPSARFATVEVCGDARSAALRLGFPIVVKPSSGAGSRLASVVRDELQLDDAMSKVCVDMSKLPLSWQEQYQRDVLLEEYLAGVLVSVEIGVSNGRKITFMVSGRCRAAHDETFELGSMMPAPITETQMSNCIDYAERVLDAIGLNHGIFHLEMILTQLGPVLVEANPRIMGGPLPRMYNVLCERDLRT